MLETVRKFGLEYCDLPTMIWSVAVLLRIVALNIDRRNAKSIPIVTFILTAACSICYFYNFQVSIAWFVFVRCRETGNKVEALMGLGLATTSLIGMTKLFFMYLYQDKVQTLVADYISYDASAAPTNSSLAITLRDVKKRALLFGIVMMGNGFVYCLQPLFYSGRHLMNDGQVLYGLEPMLETPNYQIALVNIITSVNFICFVVSIITALLIITTGYSEVRLLVLSEELQQLWPDALQHYRDNFDVYYREDKHDKTAAIELNKYVKFRLQHIVRSHAVNINLVKGVEGIFRGAIAAEFLLLTIALIAELLAGLENTYLVLPFPLMQVAMDCFTGQRLMDASIAFENAVYDCKWENFDAYNMKTVLLMLQISQKSLTLSAGGVATLSFGCFMSLIKSIYSAYTALRSTMS